MRYRSGSMSSSTGAPVRGRTLSRRHSARTAASNRPVPAVQWHHVRGGGRSGPGGASTSTTDGVRSPGACPASRWASDSPAAPAPTTATSVSGTAPPLLGVLPVRPGSLAVPGPAVGDTLSRPGIADCVPGRMQGAPW